MTKQDEFMKRPTKVSHILTGGMGSGKKSGSFYIKRLRRSIMKTSVTKIVKFETAHCLTDSYSKATNRYICPICDKEDIKSMFSHCKNKGDKNHLQFLQDLDKEINSEIDKLFPDYMQMEINEKLQIILPNLSPNVIANKIRSRAKEVGINTRKVLGKKREGINNPVHKKGVKEKISKSVAAKWEQGNYADRINGMFGKIGPLSSKYDPTVHTLKHKGINYFNSFLAEFQDITICSRCESKDKKINVHHIDENHNNFLPSNLEPLCVPCHMSNHYPQVKKPFVVIGKEFYFAAAHQLPGHEGLCKYFHGHEWKVRVEIKKRVDFQTGMVMDFSDLKKIVNTHVISVLDHNTINEIIYNPTAENILEWIWERLMFDGLLKGIYKIHLWESKDSVATLDQEGMLSLFNTKGVE